MQDKECYTLKGNLVKILQKFKYLNRVKTELRRTH